MGGYPDMEIIPAIANYFHVTIDELFGYNEDRMKKLRDIIKQAETTINAQGDMTGCVDMLRAAADVFPNVPKILVNLGLALLQQGWKKHGARAYVTDDSDYRQVDVEYNSNNIYWQEMMQVFERALKMELSSDDRTAIVLCMITTYQTMGYNDKVFDYKKRYADAMADGKYANAYQLGAKVTFPTGNFKNIDPQFWHGWVGILQKELGDRIKANPKYAECFE